MKKPAQRGGGKRIRFLEGRNNISRLARQEEARSLESLPEYILLLQSLTRKECVCQLLNIRTDKSTEATSM